ncbi:MAG: rRNA pseudouridine synthase [Candidatus Anammoximicrobium sp.]|nr:rRNA pseudouridine synthase [Candidatus Anammoximicrobium sp.]
MKRHRPPSRREEIDQQDAPPQNERLQKVLAAAGVGSRRECEELILAGRVEVDRQTVTELGTRVDPHRQQIRVDGTPLTSPKRLYFAVNKPPGVVSTNRDPAARMRVVDLVRTDERLFAVGRLDRTSEGLILVTNDGELANRLTHPRYGVDKTYLARVAGCPSRYELDRLRTGVHLAEGVVRVASVRVKRRQRETAELEIVLNEGRNREIRRILARIGHKVLQLKRIAVGPLRLGDLPRGACRPLTRDEVQMLEQAAARAREESRPPDPAGSRSAVGGRRSGTAPERSPRGSRPGRQGKPSGFEPKPDRAPPRRTPRSGDKSGRKKGR